MTATKTTTGTYQMIRLDKLIASPNNSRKTHNKEEDDQLAQSIGALGIIVPLIVRPAEKGCFDVVAGHRRLKAAEAKKLTEAPCIIKDLDDNGVELERITENGQRAEVPPIEEAEAIARLVKMLNGDIKEAAVRAGMKPWVVAARLDLLKLSTKVREAIKEGVLPLMWAQEFRRVADHSSQDDLLKDVLAESYNSPKTIEALRKLVETKYSLDLGRAIFDKADPLLCPKAGSCLGCAKRTGAQVEFFEGIGKETPDICRDRTCFEEKVKAHTAALVEAGKAGSAKVLTGAAADKAIHDAMHSWQNPKYGRLDDKNAVGRTGLQAIKALGESALAQVVTAVGRDGQAVKLYPCQALKDVMAKDEAANAPARKKGAKKSDAEKKQEQQLARDKEKRKAAQALEEMKNVVLAELIHERIQSQGWIKPPLLQVLAGEANNVMDSDSEWLLAEALGFKAEGKKNYMGAGYGKMKKVINDAVKDPKDALMVLAYGLAWGAYNQVAKKELASALGVKLDKVEAEAKERIKQKSQTTMPAALASKFTKEEEADMKKKGWVKLPDGAWTLPSEKTKALAKAAKAKGGR